MSDILNMDWEHIALVACITCVVIWVIGALFYNDSKESKAPEEPTSTITPEEFRNSIQRISTELNQWMARDIQSAQDANVDPEGSLAVQLANINTHALPKIKNELDTALTDNEFSLSAVRFFDCINHLYMTEPKEVFDILAKRFLDNHLGVLPKELPTSEGKRIIAPSATEWNELLSIYPWIPLLCIIQHEYDKLALLDQH